MLNSFKFILMEATVRALLAGIAMASFSLTAMGQEEAPAAAPEAAPAPAAAPEAAPDSAEEKEVLGGSEENRVGKMVSVVAEGGFAVAPIPMTGAAVGYYVFRDLLAEVSYVSGGVDLGIVTIDATLLEARAKYWIGNSFYVNGGFGQRTIDFSAGLDPITGTEKVKVELETKTTGLSFGLGNRWQWSYFTLGCDWLGYFAAMSSSGDTDVDVPGVEDKDKTDLEDAADQLGKASTYSALRFYLGASF